jgi:two-component system, NarL family, sensor kinase
MKISRDEVLWGLVCVLLLVPVTTRAQNPALDSLLIRQEVLRRQQPSRHLDTLMVENLSLLTERLCNVSDPRVPAYLDSLRELTEKVNWKTGNGLYQRAIGKSYDVRGKHTEALEAYSRAIELMKAGGSNPYHLSYTYVLAAFVLRNNGMQGRCMEYLEKARPLAEKLEDTNNLGWILNYYGDYNYEQGNYPKALEYYQQIENLLPRATSPFLKANNPQDLANCYQRLGKEKLADRYRQAALRIAEKDNNDVVISEIYSDLALIYEQKKQYNEAIKYYQLSLDYANESGWLKMRSLGAYNMYNIHKKAGDYRNALAFLETYKMHEDSLNRFQVEQKYDELQASYDAEKRETQIKDLENKGLVQARNFLFIILLGGVGIAAYGFWANRLLRRSNEQLLTKNREIEEALARGQNMERKRMASELHDNLNTKIAAVRWRLEALDRQGWADSNRKIMDGALEMINDAYLDIRLISHNLLPEELETKGLKVTLQKLLGKLNDNDRIEFNFVFDGQEYRLSAAVEYQLYTIVLELVNNIVKHAQADHAWISLTYQPERILLTVSDDGVGFPEPSTKTAEIAIAEASGVGLRNIQNRVEQLKGTWRVESMPQHTRISINIPLGLHSG